MGPKLNFGTSIGWVPTSGAVIFVRRRRRRTTALAAFDGVRRRLTAFDGVRRRSTAFDGVLKIFMIDIFILFHIDFKGYPNAVSVIRNFYVCLNDTLEPLSFIQGW